MSRWASTLLAALALLLASCAPGPAPAPTSAPPASPTAPLATAQSAPSPTAAPTPVPAARYPRTLTDSTGQSVTIPAEPKRIVTLQPSNTEILYALGLGDRHVAGTDFDDFPPEAKSKPKLGGLKLSAEQVLGANPDLVLATTGNSPDLVAQLRTAKVPVLVFEAKDLDDVYATIQLVGQATGAEEAATRLVATMQQRVEAVAAKTKTVANRPRVFHELDATDPGRPFTVGPGSFVDALINLAGGANIAAGAGSPYPQLSAEEIVRGDPEIIILADAAYGVTPDDVAKRPGWGAISAVRNRAIHPIDDNIVSRPGPRIVDGLEAMARIIHPELFQ